MATRQYIGARYVPKFYQNSVDGTADWENNVVYEPLTYVTLTNGHMYLSKKEVPATVGTPASNPDYWLDVGSYNGFIDELQEEIDTLTLNLTALTNRVKGAYVNVKDYGAVGDGTTDDTTAIQAAINASNVGDTIIFPNGVYKVTNKISIIDKFSTVIGFGATLKCDFLGDYVMEMISNPTYDGQGTSLDNRTDLWQLYGIYGLTIDCNRYATSGLYLFNYRGGAYYVSVHNCVKTGIRSQGITNIEHCKIKGIENGCEYGIYLYRGDNYLNDVEVIDANTAFYFGGYTRCTNINAWIQHRNAFAGSIFAEIPSTYNGTPVSIVNSIIDTCQTGFKLSKNDVGLQLTNVNMIFNTTEVVVNNPDSYLFYVDGTNDFAHVNLCNCDIVGLSRTNETRFANVEPLRFLFDPSNTFYNMQGIRKYIIPDFDDVSYITYTFKRGTFDGSVLHMEGHGTAQSTMQKSTIVTLPENYSAMVSDNVNSIVGYAYWYDPTHTLWQHQPKYTTLIRLSANDTRRIQTVYPSDATETSLEFDFVIFTGNAYMRYKENNSLN